MTTLNEDDIKYLNDILERIDRIMAYAAAGRDTFLESLLLQDAIIRNFEVIGEATKRLSPEFRQSYPHIPWRKIAGFRDVLIHNYIDVEVNEVWKTLTESLPTFRDHIQHILQDAQS